MAEEFCTVKAIPHLENETGECDHVPTFEVRIDKGDVPRRPYVSDLVDIPHIVNLRRLNGAGPVVFEVAATYSPSQSI